MVQKGILINQRAIFKQLLNPLLLIILNMNQLKDFLDDEMDDERLEKFTEDIIFQKFDAENRQIYSKILTEKYAVVREKKTHRFVGYFTWQRLSIAAAVIGLVFTLILTNRSQVVDNPPVRGRVHQTFGERRS